MLPHASQTHPIPWEDPDRAVSGKYGTCPMHHCARRCSSHALRYQREGIFLFAQHTDRMLWNLSVGAWLAAKIRARHQMRGMNLCCYSWDFWVMVVYPGSFHTHTLELQILINSVGRGMVVTGYLPRRGRTLKLCNATCPSTVRPSPFLRTSLSSYILSCMGHVQWRV